jgi:hypothetical protein
MHIVESDSEGCQLLPEGGAVGFLALKYHTEIPH